MVAGSLRHAGEELLDVAAGRDGIVGVPRPWAHRLSRHAPTEALRSGAGLRQPRAFAAMLSIGVR